MRFARFAALPLALTLSVGGFATVGAAPALAVVPVSELQDIPGDHWARYAIQTLLEKYQVMEGFPDKTFRGEKTLTRYELAAALAKVMARVEQRIAQATGQAINVDPGVNPDDLRTIARLQREFREELNQLTKRVDKLEARSQISGSNDTTYRDFVNDPGNTLSTARFGDFRTRQSIKLDNEWGGGTGFHSELIADVYSPQAVADAFMRGVRPRPVMDVYLRSALFERTLPLGSEAAQLTGAAGLGSFSAYHHLGQFGDSVFRDPYPLNGTGGYGMVGIPGAAYVPAGTTQAIPVRLNGTDLIRTLLDPNSSDLYGPHGDLFGTARLSLSWFHLSLGVRQGALTGAMLQGGAPASLAGGTVSPAFANGPTTLPGFSSWDQGAKLYATAEVRTQYVDAAVVGSAGAEALGEAAVKDKWLGAAIGVGPEHTRLNAQVLGVASRAMGDWQGNRTSLELACKQLFGQEWLGLGVGYVAGNSVTLAAQGTSGQLGVAPAANGATLFGAPDYNSFGGLLRFGKAVSDWPTLTLAAQQTGANPGGLFSWANAPTQSGITVRLDCPVLRQESDGPIPKHTLGIEYSRGKFGAAGLDASLFGTNPFTHDQVSINARTGF